MRTWAAVAVLVAFTAGGAAVDALRGGTLALTLTFLIGCVAAAALVRRRGLLAVCVAPPLAFAAAVLVSVVVVTSGSLRTQLLAVATEVVVSFPVLVAGTAAAVVVAGVRAVAERPRRARAAG